MEHFATTIALVGIVIIVASLISGAIERTGIPLVAVFLALGAALGPLGFGIADIGFDSPALRSLATLGLALVLFSDAVTIETGEVRARWGLAWRLLGPGTIVPAAIIAIAAWLLLAVPGPAAAILGAALASTDPVLLRTVLRSRALPVGARIALRLETGMNDVVLLPVIVLSMLALGADGASASGPVSASTLARHAFGLFLLGPVLGALVGWIGITALARVRATVGVRRDYESLYALGLAFSGYAAAEAVGGSGFLAAFAAGFMVASQDVELCDCFLEYGEATAEMLLLLTFVAFGTSLIWLGFTVLDWRTLLFAVIALAVRSLVLYPVLSRAGLSARERKLVALFGPRGLSSLLFTLLPVFAGIAGAERLFAVACLVVLLSVLVHGGGISLFLRRNAPPSKRQPPPSAQPTTPIETVQIQTAPIDAGEATEEPERVTLGELQELRGRGEAVVIVDARAERSFHADGAQALGAVRVEPDDSVRSATEQRLAKHATLVVYCA